MDILFLLVHLILYWIQVGAQLKLSPKELTVLRGEEARFTCSPSKREWTVMTWLINGISVLTISNETGVLPSVNPNVTAEKTHDSKMDSWVFILKHTQRHNQGNVTCDLQGITTASAYLFVQEKGSVKVFGDELAFKGHWVLFECHAVGWFPKPTLQWQVNNKKISQTEYNITEKLSLFSASSRLNLMAEQSACVDCLASVSAMSTPLNSSIHLTVVAEVVQEDDDDCTVPLAVTTSLSVLLLLLLLCICAVHWYRQRRRAKPGPLEETRDPQMGPCRTDQSWSSSSVGGGSGGNVNFGFTSESSPVGVHNEVSVKTRSHVDFTSFHKIPDVVSQSTLALHPESNDECLLKESSKTSRMITTV